MSSGEVLEFSHVTKRFGSVEALTGLSARIEPGIVTGFLGPNGAGKTTALRILLGLSRPTSGEALIGGRPYRDLDRPLTRVGAVLEASFHPGRTAANHLKVYAQAAGLSLARVDEALGAVGLADVGGRKVGGFSLGMRQRLGLAVALLGDPGVLILDEPTNGLDPEGIVWMRGLLRGLARQGRTVLVSSHLLGEVQQTADQLVILSRGRLVFQGGLGDLESGIDRPVVADAPDRKALSEALRSVGINAEVLRAGVVVHGADAPSVGETALAAGIPLSALGTKGPGIEQTFLDLVSGARVHPSADGAGEAAGEAESAERDAVDESAEPPASVIESLPNLAVPTTTGEFDGTVALLDAAVGEAPDVEVPSDEPAPASARSFHVASTGVVDVVHDPDDPDTADAAAHPEAHADADADQEDRA
ncbi:ATP-binding cassette domain-containing protein [uncultured Microbacterium sp.]|uniref:ATP-binding cassette domain-containing protein n=1 Tax=uncultured Microbacterium sp. TaxID=191216 RepID=UPI002602C3AC|nr:ATP-binding cassette domain-containing protein [uncultured Microbacterium sp.]